MNGDDRQRDLPSLWLVLAMPVSLVVTVFALGFGLIVALGLEEGGEATPTATTTQPADTSSGAALFASQGCGGCHALSSAGATGTVGPSLDETVLSEKGIAALVSKGAGDMPAFSDKLSPEEIASIASFVSSAKSSP